MTSHHMTSHHMTGENSTETFIEDQIPAYRNATALLVATISGSADVVDFLIRVCILVVVVVVVVVLAISL